MTINYYTVTLGDKQYATDAPYRNWAKIEEFYGLPRSHFKRGASSRLPTLMIILSRKPTVFSRGRN
jgi:hypothetical protein